MGRLIYRGKATCHFVGQEIRPVMALRVHLVSRNGGFSAPKAFGVA